MPLAQKGPTLREFTGVIFRAGNFTVGGGAPAFAILLREMVAKRHWMDTSGYALCYAMSRITPGTNMIAFYTACGWLLRRWRGAIAAMIAGSLPCSALVWLMTTGFDRYHQHPLVEAGINGALAASVGILLASFWLLVRPWVNRVNWRFGGAVVVGSIVLSVYFGLSPIVVLALAAVAGFFRPEKAAA